MSPHEPHSRPPRLGISFSQLVASALAAASAAFGASYLGVAGTIIGAAVASVIATVAGAMYSSSLQRARAAVQSTVTLWNPGNAVAPVADPSAPEPVARQHLPWGRLAVAAAAVLAVTLGALTGVEGLLGKPLSSAVGGSDATGTTLGSVDHGHRSQPRKKATTDTRATTPAPAPTPAQPTPTPTTDPTDPTPTPTTPAPTDPTQTPTAGG